LPRADETAYNDRMPFPSAPPIFPALGLSPAMYLLGYGTGVAAFAWLAKRRGLSTTGVWSVAVVGLVGGFRQGHVEDAERRGVAL